MCRLRIPNGILNATQFEGVAEAAERYGGGYAHVTTRANLQIREVEPKNAVALVEHIQDIGLCSRGSGADNIRNVTGTPTAGIDPQELLDTRPYAREWHFHILNDRTLYGIPRKFNVGFDGGGVIPVLEDTNDIGFSAVDVKDGRRRVRAIRYGETGASWVRCGADRSRLRSGIRTSRRRWSSPKPPRPGRSSKSKFVERTTRRWSLQCRFTNDPNKSRRRRSGAASGSAL